MENLSIGRSASMIEEQDGIFATQWQVADANIRPGLLSSPGSIYCDMEDWLKEYDGKGRYHFGILGQVYFECDEDRTMFILKWS